MFIHVDLFFIHMDLLFVHVDFLFIHVDQVSVHVDKDLIHVAQGFIHNKAFAGKQTMTFQNTPRDVGCVLAINELIEFGD